MITESSFQIKSIPFDENYHPSTDTRLTTNFANLAEETIVRKTCATCSG